MGLIKSANVPSSAQPFSMVDIEKQARAILLRARRQADEMLIAAQKEAEGMHAQTFREAHSAGKETGYAEGMSQGRQEGNDAALAEQREQLSELVSALGSVAREVDAHRQQIESEALRDVIALAVAIAERVTKRMGILDPSVVTANVEAALRMVVAASDLRIALHPDQKQALKDALPRLSQQWPALQHVQLVEDASLSRGGCRLMSGQGLIDADLDEQLRRIAVELLPEMSGKPVVSAGLAPGNAAGA